MTALQTTGLGRFSPVVIAPSYNNAQTLGGILQRLDALQLPVIVVDDGSTDDTAIILATWNESERGGRHVLSHPANRGKAAALRTAFAFAHSAGFTHAVTIDTDGQLAPEDIPPLQDCAKRRPDALIIGVRDTTSHGYPAMNRLGRWASNTLVWMESGVHVVDSQCGLRVYPLEFAISAKCRSEYFGFETEIITQAGWTGRAVLGEAVSCQYPPAGQRVSHFKPWVDSLRATRMHLRLMSGALVPWPVKTVGPSGEIFRRPTVLRRFLRWMNPMTAWRQVRGDIAGRTRFAAGFALGVFIANLPLYGVQTLLSLFVAKRFKLHPLSIVAGSNISMPPVGPLLIIGGITIGHLMLHGSLPVLADYTATHAGVSKLLLPLLEEWVIGGILLGALLAGASFLCLDFLLRATTGSWTIKTPEPIE